MNRRKGKRRYTEKEKEDKKKSNPNIDMRQYPPLEFPSKAFGVSGAGALGCGLPRFDRTQGSTHTNNEVPCARIGAKGKAWTCPRESALVRENFENRYHVASKRLGCVGSKRGRGS